MKTVDEQLSDQHMRRAGRNEAGWFVSVIDERGDPCKVWATDDDPERKYFGDYDLELKIPRKPRA